MTNDDDTNTASEASAAIRRTASAFREIEDLRRQLELPKESLPILLDIYNRQLTANSAPSSMQRAFEQAMRINAQMFEGTMRTLVTRNSELHEECVRLREECAQLRVQGAGFQKLTQLCAVIAAKMGVGSELPVDFTKLGKTPPRT
jgi:hypothetical protein